MKRTKVRAPGLLLAVATETVSAVFRVSISFTQVYSPVALRSYKEFTRREKTFAASAA